MTVTRGVYDPARGSRLKATFPSGQVISLAVAVAVAVAMVPSNVVAAAGDVMEDGALEAAVAMAVATSD